MDKYRRYEILATICVAVFIVCAAAVILVNNNGIYLLSLKNGAELKTEETGMSVFELKLGYEELSDDFAGFFTKGYEVSGYSINADNAAKLNVFKNYYRAAFIFMIISLIYGVYCFMILSKCRLYKPFLYGGAVSVIITSVMTLIVVRSGNPALAGLRSMIFKEDYGYFSDGDILKSLLLPEYARYMALGYVALVFLLIAVMALVRKIIIFHGRPHRF